MSREKEQADEIMRKRSRGRERTGGPIGQHAGQYYFRCTATCCQDKPHTNAESRGSIFDSAQSFQVHAGKSLGQACTGAFHHSDLLACGEIPVASWSALALAQDAMCEAAARTCLPWTVAGIVQQSEQYQNAIRPGSVEQRGQHMGANEAGVVQQSEQYHGAQA